MSGSINQIDVMAPISLMPEKLLDDLTDQQIRDLVAYVQTENNASIPFVDVPFEKR